jgi:hypothetical protein
MRVVALACGFWLSACGLMEPESSQVMEIMEGRVPCVGEGARECLLVRWDGTGEVGAFYDEIVGFEPEPGYRYRIRVNVIPVDNPPADGSSAEYHLEWIESKVRSPYYDLLAEARSRYAAWQETGPASYRVVLERNCYCGLEARGPVAVDVMRRTGPAVAPFEEVISARYVDGDGPVASMYRPYFPAVEGLFGVITLAAARDSHQLDVEYGLGGNVPVRIYVDGLEMAQDDEVETRVLSLDSRTP